MEKIIFDHTRDRNSAPSPLVGEGGGEGFLWRPDCSPHPNPLPQGARGQTGDVPIFLLRK